MMALPRLAVHFTACRCGLSFPQFGQRRAVMEYPSANRLIEKIEPGWGQDARRNNKEKMMINRTVTLAEIRALDPCYDPSRYAPEGWTGTLLDILDATHIPATDRIWVVTGLLDDRTNRLFAVWNSRDALSRVDNPDPRSVAVCDVAERYANGMATAEELAAALDAALDAARNAALDAARSAACAAAWDAAWDAARSAAWAVAWDAARDAQIAHLREMILEGGEIVRKK